MQGFQKDLGVGTGIRRVGVEGLSKAREPSTVVLGNFVWKNAFAEKCEI